MKRYEVVVNGKKVQVQAGRAAVAVHRAMDKFIEGEFRPAATITVHDLGKVLYQFDVTADVPFDYGDNGKGRKHETVLRGFTSEDQAQVEASRIEQAHPDWHFVRVRKRPI